jgi:hypothetical protein
MTDLTYVPVVAEVMSMAQCVYCGADVDIQNGGQASICARCSDAHEPMCKLPASQQEIRYALIQDLVEATVREKAASDEFDTAIAQFPSGLPHPHGSQLIRNASRKLIDARKHMGQAHSRLSDFLDRGIIPELSRR